MLVVAAITVSLGFWQLDRAAGKRALAGQADAARAAPPVRVGASPLGPDEVTNRRLVARGAWLSDKAVFLDNRTHAGRAGFHVFVPLRLDDAESGGRALLVLRGWVPADPADRARVPALSLPAVSGEISGLAVLRLESALQLADPPPVAERGRIWQAVSLEDYAQWSGLDLQPFVLRESPGPDDGFVRDWPQPGDDVSTHQGYALQWFLMALAVIAFWAWATWWRRPAGQGPDSP